MARIRGKNTRPEKRLRAALWSAGLRYRLHVSTPAGRPDLVFTRRKICVFIDGCFWHGCPSHYVLPRSRQEFWLAKLRDNVVRDRRQTNELEAKGWIVIRVWEHEVFEQLDQVVSRIRTAVNGRLVTPSPEWRVDSVEILDLDRDLERRHLISLRDPALRTVEERIRTTAKWRFPAD